jgi:hypothetical protein
VAVDLVTRGTGSGASRRTVEIGDALAARASG